MSQTRDVLSCGHDRIALGEPVMGQHATLTLEQDNLDLDNNNRANQPGSMESLRCMISFCPFHHILVLNHEPAMSEQ